MKRFLNPTVLTAAMALSGVCRGYLLDVEPCEPGIWEVEVLFCL